MFCNVDCQLLVTCLQHREVGFVLCPIQTVLSMMLNHVHHMFIKRSYGHATCQPHGCKVRLKTSIFTNFWTGGGIAVIHRPHLHIKKLSFNENRSFEAITINLNITTKSYLLSTIYRAPYSSKQQVTMLTFLEEFPEHVSSMLRSSKNVIILGDFNIPWNKPEHPDTTSLREILDMYDLHQHINIWTHKLGNTLDWLISNSLDTIHDITSKDFMSDHNIIEWKFQINWKVTEKGKLPEETYPKSMRKASWVTWKTTLM